MKLITQLINKSHLHSCVHNIHNLRSHNILESPKFVKNCLIPYRWVSDTMDKPPWKEAASLIISSHLSMHDNAKDRNFAETANQSHKNKPPISDYEILMVKRSRSSSFMANAYVFPGGVVEPADYSPSWWKVYEQHGISRSKLMQFSESIIGLRPPIIKDSMALKSENISEGGPLPPNIALRITALRETFEETGILLLTSPGSVNIPAAMAHASSNNIDIHNWQYKVHKDPYQFINLCMECGMCPDIWSLYEWSDWLTPTVEHRRYDTIFYLCCLPRKPLVLLDQGEVTVMKWTSPEDMLESTSDNSVFLAPPQIYELSRLLPLKSYQELLNFASKREPLGCEQYLPVIVSMNDGAVILLPGDDLYPQDADDLTKMTHLDYSLEELKLKSKKLNRMAIIGSRCILQCNITPQCGHVQPFQYRSSQPQTMSNL